VPTGLGNISIIPIRHERALKDPLKPLHSRSLATCARHSGRVRRSERRSPPNVSSFVADEDIVEQRRERRFKPNGAVTLRVLGMRPGPIMSASLCDISGSGMRLRAPLPVPCGTLIEIEAHETIALGSVCRCEPDNGAYTLGVQISETGRANRTLDGVGYGGTKGPA